MPTLQEMLDIAMAWRTAMADAMILACYAKAHELGVRIAPTRAAPPVPERGARPEEDVDWGRMVERNGDTALNHC